MTDTTVCVIKIPFLAPCSETSKFLSLFSPSTIYIGAGLSHPSTQGAKRMTLKIGDKAPDFKLKSDSGQDVKLSSFRGKKVILYFYPADDTAGCTKQACDFRDNYAIIHNADA